jgi:hypothetical protein
MPAEFEAAWHQLVDKYKLHDINVMINLWNERTTWVSAYWKEVFCARMTSTQRSESMNHVLKKGFVKEEHDLHIFAQQVNNCIMARQEAANAENIASMVSNLCFSVVNSNILEKVSTTCVLKLPPTSCCYLKKNAGCRQTIDEIRF